MTWVPGRRLWRKVYKGKVYTVSCKQLREAGHELRGDDKDGSRVAANAWWHRREFELEAAEREAVAATRQTPLGQAAAAAANVPQGREPWDRDGLIDNLGDLVKEYGSGLVALYLELANGRLPEWLASQLPPERQRQIAAGNKLIRGEEAAEPDSTFEAHAARWLAKLEARVAADHMSAGRCANDRSCLAAFGTYFGPRSDVAGLNAQALESFYAHCMKQVAARRQDDDAGEAGWSVAYARDVFRVARAFVGWLAECDVIPTPKNLSSRGFRFGGSGQTIRTWTAEEFKKAVDGVGEGRVLRLALLLMANTGMTAVDVSNLRDSEVDWAAGTVTRKRSKTKHAANVPTVTYKLWPTTFELLKKRRSGTDRVLLNQAGKPYTKSRLKADGRLGKMDIFASAWGRVRGKLGLPGRTLKQLRKLGASLLNGHPVYGQLVNLFLGHAPGSMAEKHYAAAPQELLDEAVTWLGRQLGQVP
jgi:integrase